MTRTVADLSALLPRRRSAVHPGVAGALAAVEAAPLVRLLQELLRSPSVTGSDAESEAQHAMAARLRRAGMDVDLWSVDLPSTRSCC